ncbi:MAG: 2-(1,2-epoxy-1,2-dihydrophenyl)acetyl-CoA isomerase [Anaerolineae bacterium]|nr:2-(1,2-epoxy-1,2-dihydrophenyl)acetyl-CoA isomerase [Anaerolineae bacterium]MBT7070882.1 2-(1,2-epoxy-1,2-dihydrophenyl)acetyl-CoA isomerase [Anaerolineae bacterium]MBT7326398.1 2-(1,2-epoxy-1,2-dihydrophenyl)acetyl-CoA isomerase [Anaerolineae bacterium]
MPLILSTLQQHTLTLKLNRPDKANAFNRDMILELRSALDEAEANADVRAILLTGSGATFCAGQDITEMLAAQDQNVSYHEHLRESYNPLVLKIRQIEKPIVAAINGSVAGAGLGVALACDLRIAADNAFFTVGFTGIGLVPDSGVSLLLPALIGLGRATEYSFSNLPISAQDAFAWGMVNRLIPADALLPTAAQIAMMLAMGPVGAFGATKKAFNRAMLPNLAEVLEYEGELQDARRSEEEHKVGVEAFLKKERPSFI